MYKALFYSEQFSVSKTVLDCGAGGEAPPSYVFHRCGYETHGIDIDGEAIRQARAFAASRKWKLEIAPGDMRCIPYPDNRFGCVYSYNSIFHMGKGDILESIREMLRVTEPGGILFFNLLHKNDFGYGQGIEIAKGSFKDQHDGIVHSYHDEEELDGEMGECELLEKSMIRCTRCIEEKTITQWFLEYYSRKPPETA